MRCLIFVVTLRLRIRTRICTRRLPNCNELPSTSATWPTSIEWNWYFMSNCYVCRLWTGSIRNAICSRQWSLTPARGICVVIVLQDKVKSRTCIFGKKYPYSYDEIFFNEYERYLCSVESLAHIQTAVLMHILPNFLCRFARDLISFYRCPIPGTTTILVAASMAMLR